MQLHFHSVMKQPDDLNCFVFSHTIQHEMSRAFDWTMDVPGMLASVSEVEAAKTRCKFIPLTAADAVGRVSDELQRFKDQRLIALSCLVAKLRLRVLESVDDVGARCAGYTIVRHAQFFARVATFASTLKSSRYCLRSPS